MLRRRAAAQLSAVAPRVVASAAGLDVDWQGAGDGVTYTIAIGPAGREEWSVVARTTGQRAHVDPAALPPSCDCRVRLQASDGVNVVAGDSETFRTPGARPTTIIASPRDGAVLSEGRPVLLRALIAAAGGPDLEWTVDGELVGSGATLDALDLPVGEHRAELRVRTDTGVNTASVTSRVAPDSDGDGLPDEWEQLYGLGPGDPGDAAVDADGDGLPSWMEYALGTRPDREDSDGDDYSDLVELAGGGAPNDAASLPRVLHGVEGAKPPRLSEQRLQRLLLLWPLVPVPIALAAGLALLWRRGWRPRLRSPLRGR